MEKEQLNYLDKQEVFLIQKIKCNIIFMKSLTGSIFKEMDKQEVDAERTEMDKVSKVISIARQRINGYNALIKALEASQPESDGLRILREGPKEAKSKKDKPMLPNQAESESSGDEVDSGVDGACTGCDASEFNPQMPMFDVLVGQLEIDVKYPEEVVTRNDDFYRLPSSKSLKKGVCLIINNEYNNRPGAEQDTYNFESVFTEFGYIIVKETKFYSRKSSKPASLTKIFERVKSQLRTIPKKDRSLVVLVGSHGDVCKVQTADRKKVNLIKKIIYAFDHENCEELIGRPKLFFVQACRNFRRGVDDDDDEDEEVEKVYLERANEVKGNSMTDTIICLSTSPGYWALRDPGEEGRESIGTPFVYALCKVFMEDAWESDLETMLGKVPETMRKLVKMRAGLMTTPQFTTSDFKKGFYFNLAPK